ncbi:hypothetical protein PLEOSDRAFT_153588 [Pleurotus ostreatus PC15]|uniref:BAH domain-containing protein n=1 Tax=Pleurotus ostreatus (strain PC15) TaxID=1137138 RepID=A0A067NXF2_PLEO1|nr:hypothetical protein PLEOSDRAFT_153588 [Pleurotus ostreatus PC15]
MARRRAPRLTLVKNKSKSSKNTTTDAEMPTQQEWKNMHQYGRFNVLDEEGTGYVFKVGDNAIILPPESEAMRRKELPEYRYWVGKIKDIRGRNVDTDQPDVWAHVQWYYSGEDANELTNEFDKASCSNYERIISNTHDYVSSSSFEDVVKVKKYHEDSLDQADIEDTEFFYRYQLEYKTKEISRFAHEDDPPEARETPRTPGANTCICKTPYSPSASSVLMHFCPRPSCRRWYHAKCLKGIKSMLNLKNTDAEAGRRYLATSPFTDALMRLPGGDDVAASLPTKKRRTNHAVTITPIDSSQDPECKARYDALPDDLLQAAQQPIVKGRALGGGHVVGNIRLVALARKAVYGIIDGDELEDDWEQSINPNAALVHQSVQLLLCPKCRSVI